LWLKGNLVTGLLLLIAGALVHVGAVQKKMIRGSGRFRAYTPGVVKRFNLNLAPNSAGFNPFTSMIPRRFKR